eukprot:gene5084-5740_t
MIYIKEGVPAKEVSVRNVTKNDIEIQAIEINLHKVKWLILGIYRPPSQQEKYFFNEATKILDQYSSTFENCIVLGDFNCTEANENLNDFMSSHNLENVVKGPTCFKSINPTCIDLILTSDSSQLKDTSTIETGLSDFHVMITTVLRGGFRKKGPTIVTYRDYSHFDNSKFCDEIATTFQDSSSYNDYKAFDTLTMSIFDKHVPCKRKYIRANDCPFMNKQLRKAIMTRSRLKNKIQGHNSITLLENDTIISDDLKIADILNEYFVNITKSLDITSEKEESNSTITIDDPVLATSEEFKSHSSILKIAAVVPDLQMPKVRTTAYGIEDTRYRGCQLWASLPNEIKESNTLSQFKKRVRSVTELGVTPSSEGRKTSAIISAVSGETSVNNDIIQSINLETLTLDQQQVVLDMLKKESNVFSTNEYDVGNIPSLNFEIYLTDNIPVQKSYINVTKPLFADVKAYIEDLLNGGFVRNSQSSYSSPVVCVRKKTEPFGCV